MRTYSSPSSWNHRLADGDWLMITFFYVKIFYLIQWNSTKKKKKKIIYANIWQQWHSIENVARNYSDGNSRKSNLITFSFLFFFFFNFDQRWSISYFFDYIDNGMENYITFMHNIVQTKQKKKVHWLLSREARFNNIKIIYFRWIDHFVLEFVFSFSVEKKRKKNRKFQLSSVVDYN